MRRRRLEDDNREFDELRRLTARYRAAQQREREAGKAVRGEAARLQRELKQRGVRGAGPAIARIVDWSREYVDRLSSSVDDDGTPVDGA